MLSSTETIVPKRISTEELFSTSVTFNNVSGITKFTYIRHFIRDFTISVKSFSDQLNLIDSLYRPLNSKIQPKSKEEAEYHDFIGVNISNFLNDFHKMKKVFFLDIVNRLSENLDQSDRTDLMTAYLGEEILIKNDLKGLLSFPFYFESEKEKNKVFGILENLNRIIGFYDQKEKKEANWKRKEPFDGPQIEKSEINQISQNGFRVNNVVEKRKFFNFDEKNIKKNFGKKVDKNSPFSDKGTPIGDKKSLKLNIRNIPDTIIFDEKPENSPFSNNSSKIRTAVWEENPKKIEQKPKKTKETSLILPSPKLPSIMNLEKYETETKTKKKNLPKFGMNSVLNEDPKSKDWAVSPRGEEDDAIYVEKNIEEIMKNFSDYKNTMSLEDEDYQLIPKNRRFTPNKIKAKKPVLRPEDDFEEQRSSMELRKSAFESIVNSYVEIGTERKVTFGVSADIFKDNESGILKFPCYNKKGNIQIFCYISIF